MHVTLSHIYIASVEIRLRDISQVNWVYVRFYEFTNGHCDLYYEISCHHDPIWRNKSESILANWCHQETSHYPNQCGLIVNNVLWHLENFHKKCSWTSFVTYVRRLDFYVKYLISQGQWVNELMHHQAALYCMKMLMTLTDGYLTRH